MVVKKKIDVVISVKMGRAIAALGKYEVAVKAVGIATARMYVHLNSATHGAERLRGTLAGVAVEAIKTAKAINEVGKATSVLARATSASVATRRAASEATRVANKEVRALSSAAKEAVAATRKLGSAETGAAAEARKLGSAAAAAAAATRKLGNAEAGATAEARKLASAIKGASSAQAKYKSSSGGATKSLHGFADMLSQARKGTGGLGNAMSKIGTSGALRMAGGIGLAVGAVVTLTGAYFEWNKEVLKTTAVFDNLTISISAAKESTMGLVNDLDLATAATKATRMQVVETSADYAELAGAAVKLGLSAGIEAKQAVDDLTRALATNSTQVLDNLGISLRVEEAQLRYAKSLGVSVKSLTKDQKAMAFRVEGRKAAIAAARNLVIAEDSAAMATGRAAVSAENMLTKMRGGTAGVASMRMELQALIKQGLVKSNVELANHGGFLDTLKKRLIAAGVSQDMLTHVHIADFIKELNIARKAVGEYNDKLHKTWVEQQALASANGMRVAVSEVLHELDKEKILLEGMVGTQDELRELAKRRAGFEISLAVILGEKAKEEALRRAEALRLLQSYNDILKETEGNKPPKHTGGGGRKGPTKRDFARQRFDEQKALALQGIEFAEVNGAKHMELLERRTVAELAFNKQMQTIARDRVQLLRLEAEEELILNRFALDKQRHHNQVKLDAEREFEGHIEAARAARLESDKLFAFEQLRLTEDAEAEKVRIKLQSSHFVDGVFFSKRLAANEAIAFEEQSQIDGLQREYDRLQDHGAKKADLLEVESRMQTVHHNAYLQRLKSKQSARKQTLADIKTGANVTNQVINNGTQIASLAATAGIKDQERLAKFVNRAKGVALAGTAVKETVEAAVSFASFNIPGGILHTSAAALAATNSALLLSGRLDSGAAGGSATKIPTGGGGAGPGSGGSQDRDAPRSGDIPLSVANETQPGRPDRDERDYSKVEVNIFGEPSDEDIDRLLSRMNRRRSSIETADL